MNENKDMVKVEEQEHANTWDEALEKEAWTAPLSDIYENDDNYYITLAMPGVKKDGVKIKVEDDSLVVMGRKADYSESFDRKYIMKENETANYYRKFRLTEAVDDGKIDAVFEDGMLKLVLPKHERVKPRNIEIK